MVGDEVVVVWGDGHESYYPGCPLRKACSCASCKGERHLFGRATLPTLAPLRPEAFVPAAVSLVGNYGLKAALDRGYKWCEYSWILEDNELAKRTVRLMDAEHTKTYRIYSKPV